MYQVLYRKWRPQKFSDVVGQPQVTTTLKNELKSGRISHAYLFTGTRGTGKTTCAKILARAVNCLSPVDGDPCGQCEICKGIENGNILDVVEIDAASNNGVENIRSLRDETVYTPSEAKYRVYIIDEVHMLSQGAFNALLKTLEEPPAHVIFILATTEIHKIPATILSRCQRFDFNRISPEEISSRLQYVAQNENITLDNDAARLIAFMSDGAMRDALSLLDRCIGFGDTITAETVRETAGLASSEYLYTMAQAVINKDASQALNVIDTLYKASKDMLRLCEELSSLFRDLLLVKTMKKPKDIVAMTDSEFEKASEMIQQVSLSDIIFIIDALQLSLEKMARSVNKRIQLEITVVRLCSRETAENVSELSARLTKLERLVNSGAVIGRTQAQSNVKQTAAQPLIQSPSSSVNYDEIIKNAKPMEDWHAVLEVLKNYSITIATAFEPTKAYISGDYLLIDAKSDVPFRILKQSAQKERMRDAIREVTGKTYKLGPYKKPEEKQEVGDELLNFARNVRDSGVDIKINGENN